MKRPRRGSTTNLIAMMKKRKCLRHQVRPLDKVRLLAVGWESRRLEVNKELRVEMVPQEGPERVLGSQRIQPLKLEECTKRPRTNMKLLQNRAKVLEILCKPLWM